MTEKLLWSHLKGRGLDGFKFRHEHFIDPFVVDFVCLEAQLVVEVDGSSHHSAEARARDAARDEKLAAMKFRVLRVSADDVECELGRVLTTIRAALPAAARPSVRRPRQR